MQRKSPLLYLAFNPSLAVFMTDFRTFFSDATQGRGPYPYQEQFATSDALPHLIRAPTGAGKTATAVLGWLWRWTQKFPGTPRRLVYCLPMRVLVEQSTQAAESWIKNLELDVKTHVLMGGVDTEEWYLSPEKPAILIGTQDMLLSRALNRGYAASRFHWPIDFALLNNDCLWVFDEPQLMGSGVSTSAQLAGLRESLGVQFNCPSVWMSATLEPAWLDTIDFRGKFTAKPLELDPEKDYEPKLPLHKRMTAAKKLQKLAVAANDAKAVASAVMKQHQAGTQTLVIANTVDRAKDIYAELGKQRKKSATPALLLVHSRFRPQEREKLNEELQTASPGDRIIVATQVVEAGVDISSRTLVTELAPWSSIVQRIGRCNRTGDDGNTDHPANVFWIDLPEKLAPPYENTDLESARVLLSKLEGNNVSPKALDDFKRDENITLQFEHKHVLRRRDLLDLFDTTPDLSGNDIDIQRFIRSDDPETDVQLFWREFIGLPEDRSSPARLELCNVPIGQFRKFIEAKKSPDAFIWDHLEDEWKKLDPRQIRPGLTILLPTTGGGYSEELGWNPASSSNVTAIPNSATEEESIGSDQNTSIPIALTIAQHTKNVCTKLEQFISILDLAIHREPLEKSALWHDVGKAHAICQQAQRAINASLDENELWAKTGKRGKLRYARKYFRHELASALIALQHQLPFLAAYLIASHHGKVRLSIRSLPGEDLPDDATTLFALGIHDGDELPEVSLDGTIIHSTKLDLSPMQLGGDRSWTAQALKLLADLGPFKLAYLETVLRIADQQASNEEAHHAQ